MSGDVKVLLVGAGPMARAYAKVLNALRASWIAVGRGAGSAETFAKETGVTPMTRGLAGYLRSNSGRQAEMAIVALPISQLAAATKDLAKAGVQRVLVEKPAGVTVSEIGDVAETAGRTGCDIFVGYNRRFYSSVDAARALIAADGGVSSFHFEFTELADRILGTISDRAVLNNWLLANSSHVVDLAFNLCGAPATMSGAVGGSLDWHPSGAVFAGHGRTQSGALFTWHADWTSAGRWGVDVRTARRRLILQPLETLSVQEKGSLTIAPCVIADELDHRFKPGLFRQVEAFLSVDPGLKGLPTIAAHYDFVRRWYSEILSHSVTMPRAGLNVAR